MFVYVIQKNHATTRLTSNENNCKLVINKLSFVLDYDFSFSDTSLLANSSNCIRYMENIQKMCWLYDRITLSKPQYCESSQAEKIWMHRYAIIRLLLSELNKWKRLFTAYGPRMFTARREIIETIFLSISFDSWGIKPQFFRRIRFRNLLHPNASNSF